MGRQVENLGAVCATAGFEGVDETAADTRAVAEAAA